MSTQQCPICTLKFTSSIRRKIECSSCQQEYCTTCLKSYLQNCEFHISEEGRAWASCMNPGCEQVLGRKFLLNNLTMTFHTKVYRHRESKVQMNVERALLTNPAVQREAATERQGVINKPLIINLRKEITDLYAQIREKKNKKIFLELGWSEDQYIQGFNAYNLHNKLRRVRKETVPTVLPTEKRSSFVYKCPVADCRGTLDNYTYKCHLCAVKCCRSCLEIKEEGHECNPDTVATIQEMRYSCKPCPNPVCGVPTQRSYGCNQMWCVECHTFWNWQTGKILKGGFRHNPEYLLHMASGGTLIEEPTGCCQNVGYREMDSIKNTRFSNTYTYWVEVLRALFHLRDYQDQFLVLHNREERNKDLAVRYLTGSIDELKWEALVRQRAKSVDSTAEEREGVQFLIHITDNLLSNVLSDPDRDEEFRSSLKEAESVFNKQMEDLSRVYNVATLKVNGQLLLTREKRSRNKS